MPGPGTPGPDITIPASHEQAARHDHAGPVDDVALLVAHLALAQLADQVRDVVGVRAGPRAEVLLVAHSDHGNHSSRGRCDPAFASEPGSVAGRPLTGTPASRSTVARLEISIGSGSAGQGVITTPDNRQPRGPGGLDRQQRVVDRAQAGAGRDHERQAEVDREVAHEVARRDRHEQAADALRDQHAGRRRRRARPRRSRAGSIVSPASSAA